MENRRSPTCDPSQHGPDSAPTKPDPTGGDVLFASRNTDRLHERGDQLEGLLARLHLPDVSPVVIGKFQRSLRSWRDATQTHDPSDFTRGFRQMAALLSHPEVITDQLAEQPSRNASLIT